MIQQRNQKIEQMKANAAKWELKSKELAYKQELITVYENLQKKGMSKKKILKFYPVMAGFMTEDEDNLDNDKDSEHNNKKKG